MVKVKIKVNIGSWGPPQEAAEQYAEMVARAVDYEKTKKTAEQNEKNLQELEKKNNELRKDVDGIDYNVYIMSQSTERIESELEGVYSALYENEVTASENNERFEKIETDLSEIQTDIEEIKADIENARTRTAQLETDVAEHEEQINSLAESVQLNSNHIDDITEWYANEYNSYTSLTKALDGAIKNHSDSKIDKNSEYPVKNKVIAEELRVLKYGMPKVKFFANDWVSGAIITTLREYNYVLLLMSVEDVSDKLITNITVVYDGKEYLASEAVEAGLLNSEAKIQIWHTPQYDENYGMYETGVISGVSSDDELFIETEAFSTKVEGFNVYYFEK